MLPKKDIIFIVMLLVYLKWRRHLFCSSPMTKVWLEDQTNKTFCLQHMQYNQHSKTTMAYIQWSLLISLFFSSRFSSSNQIVILFIFLFQKIFTFYTDLVNLLLFVTLSLLVFVLFFVLLLFWLLVW